MWCDRMQFVQTSQSDRLMLVTSLLSQLPWYFSWKIQCSRRQNHRHLTTYFRLVVDMARELSKNIPNFQLKCGAHDTKCKDYSNRDIRSAIEKVKSQLLIKNVSGHITGSQFAFQAIECPTVHGSILFNLYGSILTSSPMIADQNRRKKNHWHSYQYLVHYENDDSGNLRATCNKLHVVYSVWYDISPVTCCMS